MPVQAQDCAPDGFLQQSANPPITLRVKGADSNGSSTACYSKLVFKRRPSDEGCSTVDTEQDKCGFPSSLTSSRVNSGVPDIGISVLS